MKKRALVTGGTAKDTAAIACLALNIKETNSTIADEIVVFHDGIRAKDRRIINKIFPTRFIRYRAPFESSSLDTGTVEYFSLMVFCKYECLLLLDEYEQVIWSDYDVVITKELTNLSATNGETIKLLDNPTTTFADQFLPDFDRTPFDEFDLTARSISLPIFVLTDKLPRYRELYDYLISATRAHSAQFRLPEQAGFQMMIQHFRVPYTALRETEYVWYPTAPNVPSENKILHAYGQPKFWNGLYNEQWERYYAVWRKMGGSKHLDRYNKTERLLRRIELKVKKVLGVKDSY